MVCFFTGIEPHGHIDVNSLALSRTGCFGLHQFTKSVFSPVRINHTKEESTPGLFLTKKQCIV